MKPKKHKVNPLRHEIKFTTVDSLHITVETERLFIQSITDENEKDCIALFADPVVMSKYETGFPVEEQKTKERLNRWKNRWKNHDPYSVYAIAEKNSGEFIGIIGIGHVSPGKSETYYAIHSRFWGKGYGNEAVDAVIQSLIPRLMLRDYKLEHVPLKKVVATVCLDNLVSQKMLLGLGFQEEGEVHLYGARRKTYGFSTIKMRNNYQNFFANNVRRAQREAYLSSIDEDVDVTAAEMAASSFGRLNRK